jgi:hypothetical protein
MKNNYTVIVGTEKIEFTRKAMADDCFLVFINLSKTGQTFAAGKDVYLMKNNIISKTYFYHGISL